MSGLGLGESSQHDLTLPRFRNQIYHLHPQSLTVCPLKNGGKGRRSFPIAKVTFQGLLLLNFWGVCPDQAEHLWIFSKSHGKIEWDRIPTDPGPSNLLLELLDTQVFSGSVVSRGSDRWVRFLEDKKFRGLMDPRGGGLWQRFPWGKASEVYMGLRASIKSFGQDEAR